MGVLKWGILSAGKISHDFVNAIKIAGADHEVVAVAARDLGRAQAFAKKFEIPKAYGSYEELSKDSDVHLVYIGSVTPEHLKNCMLMLNAGKNILCEKPLGMNVGEVKEILAKAKEKKVFFMEGVWSRFMPAYKQIREELFEKKEVGKPLTAMGTFCICFGEDSRVLAEGGGVIPDIGIYILQLVLMVFGRKPVKSYFSGGKHRSGVDYYASMHLDFGDGQNAVFHVDGRYNGLNNAAISCEKGHIEIEKPFWCPLKLRKTVVEAKDETQGMAEPVDSEFTFDLPGPGPYKMNFNNSELFVYEIQSVKKCIDEGFLENPLVPHELTIALAELIDEARGALGVAV